MQCTRLQCSALYSFGGNYAAYWDKKYTQAVNFSTEELEEIIANNQ